MESPPSLLSDDTRGLFDHAATIADNPVDPVGSDEFADSEQHAIDYLGEHDLELIRSDENRLVFTVADEHAPGNANLILKLARHGDGEMAGRVQNQTEQTIWETAETEDIRQHLAPVLDANDDGAWVVMPQTAEAGADAVAAVREAAADNGWNVDAIDSEGVGILTQDVANTPVLRDYGHNVIPQSATHE